MGTNALARRSLAVARTPYGVFALAGATAIAVYEFLPATAQAALWESVGFASAAAIIAGVRLFRPRRPGPWLLLAGGVLVNAIADLVWDSLYTWGSGEPGALSPADAIYLSSYPFLAASLVLFGGRRQPTRGPAWATSLDTAILVIPVCALAWTFLIDPVLESGTVTGLNAVQMVYPVVDLGLVALAVWLGLGGRAATISYGWLLLAFVLLVPADTLTRDLLLAGEYQVGEWADVFYLGAYVAWGLAGLHPSMHLLIERRRTDERQLTGRRLAFLAAATLSTPLVLIAAWTEFDDLADRLFLDVVALVVPLLVLLRLAGMLRLVEGLAAAFETAKRNLAAVLRASPLPMCVLDPETRVTLWNAACERMWGWGESEVLGRPVPIEPADEEHRLLAQETYERVLAGKPVDGVELPLLTRAGQRIDVGIWTTPLRDDAGRIAGAVTTGVDVTERKRQEEEIRFLAGHDPLTGLPNRRFFEAGLAEAIRRAGRPPSGALLVIDVDNFKLVNDTAGHLGGDRFLVAVAELLRAAVRPGDLVSRLGGDEFGIVLYRLPLSEARAVCDRILAASTDFRFDEAAHTFDLGLSMGLAPFDGSAGVDRVLAQADAALYRAKDQGKNRVVVRADPVRDSGAVTRVTRLATRVKDALRENRLVLELQPIIELATGDVAFHEVLVRMRDDSGELLPPAAFLPTAERFGLMPRVDSWVAENTFRLLEEDPTLRLFVNLAGSSLTDDALIEQIEAGIRLRSLQGRVGFEITETAAVRDMHQARKRLGQLAGAGCPLALDDFGTGFSSFSHLQLLPAGFVKIGAPFVRGIADSPTSRAIVRAIAEVAHALGKQVIAETVESERALAVVDELGIEFAQGFVFGRPRTPSEWAKIVPPSRAESAP